MKIVTIINGLNNGGAEKFAVELCNELATHHVVYLFVKMPIDGQMIPPRNISNKVHLVVFNSKQKWDILFLFKLLFWNIRIRPDIIHLHSSILFFYTFFFPMLFWKTKIYQTIHSQVTPAYSKILSLSQRISRLGLGLRHIVISSQIKKDYESRFPKITFLLVENGVKSLKKQDDSLFKRPAKNSIKRLLAIGHFGDVKRFDLLADIMELPQIRMRFSLQIIGQEKGDEKRVTRYIQQKNLDNIALLGLKENVADYIHQADALVIWSSYEGMPLVMLEALSMGCPVISSPVGGVVDVIVSGENGILTKGLDQSDLVEALLEFNQWSDEKVMKVRENNIHLYKECYSIERCANRYLSLFQMAK